MSSEYKSRLLAALGTLGVTEFTDNEARLIRWLAGWDDWTVDTVIGLLRRVGAAQANNAAPDLLDALREIIDALNDNARRHDCAGFDCATCQPSRLHEIASDAITKATGGGK